MKLKDLLEEAIKQTKNLNSGELFMVKKLFRGVEWNRIDRGLRMKDTKKGSVDIIIKLGALKMWLSLPYQQENVETQ